MHCTNSVVLLTTVGSSISVRNANYVNVPEQKLSGTSYSSDISF